MKELATTPLLKKKVKKKQKRTQITQNYTIKKKINESL